VRAILSSLVEELPVRKFVPILLDDRQALQASHVSVSPSLTFKLFLVHLRRYNFRHEHLTNGSCLSGLIAMNQQDARKSEGGTDECNQAGNLTVESPSHEKGHRRNQKYRTRHLGDR